jgi:Holliday junction resolvasome RuvABC endonuclease subunit
MPRFAASSSLRILGLDPALRTLGFAVVEQSGSALIPIRLGLITTEEVPDTSLSESNFDAAQNLARVLMDLFNRHPIGEIRAEAMSYPPSASSAAKISTCWGVLAAMTLAYGILVKQASPQTIRKTLGLPKRSAKEKTKCKEDVVNAMEQRFGKSTIAQLLAAEGITRKADKQHPIDALAAVVVIR